MAPIRNALQDLALGLLGRANEVVAQSDSVEARRLRGWGDLLEQGPHQLLEEAELDPRCGRIWRLQRELGLTISEVLGTALITEVEAREAAGRVLAWLQAPVAGSRPTIGLMATSLELLDPGTSVASIASSTAVQTGLWELLGDGTLPERPVAIPRHLLLSLEGVSVLPPGGKEIEPLPLPASVREESERRALALTSGFGRTLVIRSGSPREALAVAMAVAEVLGRRAVALQTRETAGLVPWLVLAGAIPVFDMRLAPSERFVVPELPGWDGPVLVATGPEGAVEADGGEAPVWRVPVPNAGDRALLWVEAVGSAEVGATMGHSHRHGIARIAELGQLARQQAAMEGRTEVTAEDVLEATWQTDAGGLSALAQPINTRVPDEALVLSTRVRQELELLTARCRRREGLASDLGIATRTRYRSGVRTLFVGASGTGKTLAASWLATRLALPLFRVDMAAVVSKYIGETEKNLSELLARAEAAEVVLFFDEADTLFGKRTDVQHASDRHANSQTNYLLQRIESYDGVVVLTSNSRDRFDPAFSRRLDVILEFPPPGPELRRDLWRAHLGKGTDLSQREVNQLAVRCDLVGGHVRNAVLTAAILAAEAGRRVAFEDVVTGVLAECRKLGRPPPAGLLSRRRAEPDD